MMKKRRENKTWFRFISILLLHFSRCNILFYFFSVDISKINDNDFLFTFLGILLGLAITIFTFIISLSQRK